MTATRIAATAAAEAAGDKGVPDEDSSILPIAGSPAPGNTSAWQMDLHIAGYSVRSNARSGDLVLATKAGMGPPVDSDAKMGLSALA